MSGSVPSVTRICNSVTRKYSCVIGLQKPFSISIGVLRFILKTKEGVHARTLTWLAVLFFNFKMDNILKRRGT